jgi:hypothetical protein
LFCFPTFWRFPPPFSFLFEGPHFHLSSLHFSPDDFLFEFLVVWFCLSKTTHYFIFILKYIIYGLELRALLFFFSSQHFVMLFHFPLAFISPSWVSCCSYCPFWDFCLSLWDSVVWACSTYALIYPLKVT